METTFTPGPWKIGRQHRHDAWIHNADGKTVCYVHNATGYRPDCSDDPNSQLIAAAPELLDLCQRMQTFADAGAEFQDDLAELAFFTDLENAIAKATVRQLA